MTRDEVRCPSCAQPAGSGCRLPDGKPYTPGHSARITYAAALTRGPKVGDALYRDRKYRLRSDGSWRATPNASPLAFHNTTRVDYDAVAHMWRFKVDGPLVLASAKP